MSEEQSPYHAGKDPAPDPLCRRLGRFKVSRNLLRDAPSKLLPALFAKMVVVEATSRWEMDCVEYVAMSALFDEVPTGSRAPLYELIVSKHGNQLAVFSKKEDR